MSDEPISAEVMAQIRKRAGWDVNGIPYYRWITGPHAQVYADRGSLLYHVSVLERKISDLEGKLKQRDEAHYSKPLHNPDMTNSAHGLQKFHASITDGSNSLHAFAATELKAAELLLEIVEGRIQARETGVHPSHETVKIQPLNDAGETLYCVCCGAFELTHEGRLMFSEPCAVMHRAAVLEYQQCILRSATEKPTEQQTGGIHPSHSVMRWGKLSGGKVVCGCMDCGAVDTNHEGALALSQPCAKRKA